MLLRESIARDDLLAALIGDASLMHWFQAENRDRLARLLIHDGRRDDARTVLEQGAADLGAIAADGRPLRGNGHQLAEKLGACGGWLPTSYGDDRRAD